MFGIIWLMGKNYQQKIRMKRKLRSELRILSKQLTDKDSIRIVDTIGIMSLGRGTSTLIFDGFFLENKFIYL